jgi:hypothetical protein
VTHRRFDLFALVLTLLLMVALALPALGGPSASNPDPHFQEVTETPTSTVTDTPTNTPTSTITDTPTNTPTSTVTDTPTNTPISTVTGTVTAEIPLITICHTTSSATNPYVLIKIEVTGLSGHQRHAGDIIPAPLTGCPTTRATSTPVG